MTRPTRLELNCETGVETIIELTDAEIADLEKARAEADALRAAEAAKAEAIAALKESAKAKLIAGEPLTEEEASVLVI